MKNLPVEYLIWDSDFFNRRIARVTSGCLRSDEVERILTWAVEERIDCLYYLANGQEINSTSLVEANGFHFVDLRVTFIKDLTKPEQPFIPSRHIRRADEKDLSTLKELARKAFQLSRFHVDAHFDQAKADLMYEVWVENDLRTTGHDVWVIDMEGQLAAYTSVSVKHDGKAQIGLVGTQADWRGKGLALELQRFVGEELQNEGIREVEVVTQGRNIAEQNLYQQAGYFTRSIDLWYHKWFE
jgi:dTDP-4-amino-4,6-dideoxy-D-galactose acyltransferase